MKTLCISDICESLCSLGPIIERVGGSDAFTAGLIYGLRRKPDEKEA